MKTLRHCLQKIEDPNLSDKDGSKILKILFTEMFLALNVNLDKQIFSMNHKRSNKKSYNKNIDKTT